MSNGIKMYIIVSPNGDQMPHSLCHTSRDCKTEWAGGYKDWQEWRLCGWKVKRVLVTINPIQK